MVQVLSIHSRHCSLALGNPCSPSERLLHLHPAHQTDLPTYLPKALASDCSCQRGGERCAPLLVSLVTTPSPLHPPSEDCQHVLPTSCHTQCKVSPGPCFRPASAPHPLDHRCLCCCLWPFFGLEAGRVQVLQALGCSPTAGKKTLP